MLLSRQQKPSLAGLTNTQMVIKGEIPRQRIWSYWPHRVINKVPLIWVLKWLHWRRSFLPAESRICTVLNNPQYRTTHLAMWLCPSLRNRSQWLHPRVSLDQGKTQKTSHRNSRRISLMFTVNRQLLYRYFLVATTQGRTISQHYQTTYQAMLAQRMARISLCLNQVRNPQSVIQLWLILVWLVLKYRPITNLDRVSNLH